MRDYASVAFEPGTEYDRAVTAIGSARYVLSYGPKELGRPHSGKWAIGKHQAGSVETFGKLDTDASTSEVEGWATQQLAGHAANAAGIANGLIVDFLLGRPSLFAGHEAARTSRPPTQP
jgi:hypothetical protein